MRAVKEQERHHEGNGGRDPRGRGGSRRKTQDVKEGTTRGAHEGSQEREHERREAEQEVEGWQTDRRPKDKRNWKEKKVRDNRQAGR